MDCPLAVVMDLPDLGPVDITWISKEEGIRVGTNIDPDFLED
jgi:hypothetical protein